ncbi:MAG TPA: hypothetical protein ENK47_01335 [Euryarchaeota archaeon]|nr:hypothetical protein [Euryarchaeota archaeon]
MRWSLFALSVFALLVNSSVLIFVGPDGIREGVTNSNDDGNGTEPPSEITTLTVPAMKIGDQILYDYDLFAEMYWENYTSGEWQRYTFSGEGTLLQYVDDLTFSEDGFGSNRKSVRFGIETKASFRARIQSSDGDDVTVPGNLDVERSEFKNLYDRHPLKALNHGTLNLENVGTLINPDLPGGLDLDFTADLRSYPTPSIEPVQTLDESIYGSERMLRTTSRGSYQGDPLEGEDNRIYNWSVEGAYKVKEHDTFKINVTSSFWDFADFKRVFYISEDSPFPLKGTTRTNTSAYWETGEFYIIIETHREVKEDGIVAGENPIPWGDSSGHKEYDLLHPAGEFEPWEYGPADGSDLEHSSFEGWTLEDAVEYAKEKSPSLRAFLDEYESRGTVLIEDSVYNISTEDKLRNNQTQWWNLSFSYVFSTDEWMDYYNEHGEAPYWRYKILVARSIDSGRTDSGVSRFIAGDEGDDSHGLRKVWVNDGLNKDFITLNSKILTLTHGEKILKIDQEVKDRAFEDNRIKEGVKFYYGVVGITEQSTPGLALVESLTGISTPTADNAIGFQQDELFESGGTFSAAVDANTGQLLYVMSVEGNEFVTRLFG